MSTCVQNLQAAMQRAMTGRPPIGGFPYMAETLRQAGVNRNLWQLPSCQSVYMTDSGAVVMQGTPLVTGMVEVPAFNEAALITALRTDQAGRSSFPEFLAATWQAGITSYDVDFHARTCTYFGVKGEKYVEAYPAVEI